MQTVYEFDAGKNNWNTFRVGIDEGRIVIKDETGILELEDEDVDDLISGIDQARRALREEKRQPTQLQD